VQFGLQFEAQPAHSRPREVEPPKPAAAAKAEAEKAATVEDAEETPAQDEPAKVVSLDQFRKK